jgi:hypothetical protein
MKIRPLKIRIVTIVLVIVALILVLRPPMSYSQPPATGQLTTSIGNPSETDSPCFYRQTDGTIVDLRSICGQRSTSTPSPGRMAPSGNGAIPQFPSTPTNPAMQITPPNDPGVLYLSGSGSDDRAAAAASRAEQKPR